MEGVEVGKIIRGNTTIEELFGIIESAIEVAATKYPQEFSSRKSQVLELLSTPSSLMNKDQEALPTNINNVEEPEQKKKKHLLKLKIKGRIISKVCDKRSMEKSVTNISLATVTHQEVIKKNEEINNNDLKLEAFRRKIAQSYTEAEQARPRIKMSKRCDLPREQDFSVIKKKVRTKPRTFCRS